VPSCPASSHSSYPYYYYYSSYYYSSYRRMSTSTASLATANAKVEEAKELAAKKAVAEHFSADFKFVGIGSGTTIVYVINEIKRVLGDNTSKQLFVPTGYQSRQAIVNAGLTPIAFDTLPDDVILDVAFDGADEVDDDLNCIKGGGACLFQEKLVAERARKFVCVAGIYIHMQMLWASAIVTKQVCRLQKAPTPALNKLAHDTDRGRSDSRPRSPLRALDPRLAEC
jgi:hypothetical protein